MHNKNLSDRIRIEPGAYPEKHELHTAEALAQKYTRIVFMRPINKPGVKTADIRIGGLEWEIKSPKTKTLSGIEQALKRATKQSGNVIIDSYRVKVTRDVDIEAFLKRKLAQQKAIKNLILINKHRQIIDIK